MMYNGTTDRFLYDALEMDDDLTPDGLIDLYRHQTTDPLTGIDDVFMDAWLFEDEDTEFLEERPLLRFHDALHI